MKRYSLITILVYFLMACSGINENNTHQEINETNTYIEQTTNAKIDEINNQNNETIDESKSEEEIIELIYEKVKSIDFTIQESSLNLSPEVDELYRRAYLDILKNNIPTTNYYGEKEYFRDLYKLGVEFNQLKESEYTSYYYYDLDGDGLPELGIRSTGYTYILKYELGAEEFSILFDDATMYHTILGTGQIGFHNGLHAWYIADRYIVLHDDGKWKPLVEFERSNISEEEIENGVQEYFQIKIDDYKACNVGEEIWNEITAPFFEMTKQAIPSMNLEEVFGELLLEE